MNMISSHRLLNRLGDAFARWLSPAGGLASVDVLGSEAADLHALQAARDEAERASRAKSRFLAMTSHEIRTPLNGIIGMAKLLADTELTPEQQNYVDAMTGSSEALLALVSDLMEFARFEAGDMEFHLQRTAIQPLVSGVTELLCGRAYTKGVDLGYYLAPDVPDTAVFDPGRMRQVLMNIIGNAIKFTDHGGVSIDVGYENDTLDISVRDTGPGIARRDQDRIFGEFEQVSIGSDRQYEGIGLGLAISRRIVEAAGGNIEVDSRIGAGSCFTVRFPVSEAGPETAELPRLDGHAVAILSPHTVEAELMARMLNDAGAVTTIHGTRESALSACKDHPRGSTLIVDNRFEGGANGFLKERLACTKMIALIEAVDRGSIGAQFKDNGHAFLTRPVRPTTLLRIVAQVPQEYPVAVSAVASNIMTRPSFRLGSGLYVLVAEDNPVNALLTMRMLEKMGHRVNHVENGEAAVEAVRRSYEEWGQSYDIVLMDLHMPVLDGVDAITAVRRLEDENELLPVPILVLTADVLPETHAKVMNAGANGILTKPIEPDEFITQIAQLNQQAA
jgi:signal transduction histidine kinase/CheY-like chemotaxis protein